jgi:hypothetical protein
MDQSSFSAGPSTLHQQGTQSSTGDDAEPEPQSHEVHNIQPIDDAQLVAQVKHSLRTLQSLLVRTGSEIHLDEPMLEQWREGQLPFQITSKHRWNHESDDSALFDPIAEVLKCLVVGDFGTLTSRWTTDTMQRIRKTRMVNVSHCPGVNVRITMAHAGRPDTELDQEPIQYADITVNPLDGVIVILGRRPLTISGNEDWNSLDSSQPVSGWSGFSTRLASIWKDVYWFDRRLHAPKNSLGTWLWRAEGRSYSHELTQKDMTMMDSFLNWVIITGINASHDIQVILRVLQSRIAHDGTPLRVTPWNGGHTKRQTFQMGHW